MNPHTVVDRSHIRGEASDANENDLELDDSGHHQTKEQQNSGLLFETYLVYC